MEEMYLKWQSSNPSEEKMKVAKLSIPLTSLY